VRQAERDGGRRPGLTTDERARFKQFERENVELRHANEILRLASAYFAKAERPPSQVMVLRYVPPSEFETAYHDRQAPVGMAVLT
jgi:transposase